MASKRQGIKFNWNIANLIHVPEEYKDEFIKELLRRNISRDLVLSYLLVAISSVLLYFDITDPASTAKSGFMNSNFLEIHSMLLFASLAFLLLTHIKPRVNERNVGFLWTIHLLLNLAVLVLCALIAVDNEFVNKPPFAYIIAMFSIASMVLLTPLEKYCIYFSSYAIYFIGLITVQKDFQHVMSDTMLSILLLVLALIVSNTHYLSFAKNFINHKIILKKNQELDALYRTTEEVLKERTEELNQTMEYEKLRTAFFANISHELRTPLTLIFSAHQMLDLSLNNSKGAEIQQNTSRYSKIIRQNCYRLIRLISNLIDITKIDAGYFKVNLRNCDIVAVVEDITLSVAEFIKGKNITLLFDTELEECIIACDPDKIERIMLNLLSNAIKFTPAGGEIFVNIYERQDHISVCVKDTGVGIPEEMKESIFERFVQVDKTISRNREGSGIGLSLVRSLVEMHNGKVSLTSEVGKGSTFTFEIPNRVTAGNGAEEEHNLMKGNQNIEKINIEFSDIYH